jgi:glycosyltransferase involved in cell wall biosynthesis
MRIAMLGQKGMPAVFGGVERHVHDLSLHLAKNGHQVTVYSRQWYTGKNQDEIYEGVKIKYLPTWHTKHLDAIVHTWLSTWHAIFNDFEIIHYHGVGPALLSWLPRIFAPHAKVIVTFHSIDRYHQKWNWLARFFLRLGEWCACRFPHQTITVSQTLEKYCFNEFNVKTIYIPNGVPSFGPVVSENQLQQFNLEKNKYLVMISRLIPHKGAHLLVEAFVKLKKTFPQDEKIRELKLAIVGGGVYTDKYVRNLHRLASACNEIIFTDFQAGENLEQLYTHALALVHPSLNEGLPITVLQAMAYGRPVLVSNLAEHRELIDDNRFIFKENDVDDLVKKIQQFLQLPTEEKNKAGLANQSTTNNVYHWEKIVPQIEDVYKNDL